MNKRVRTVSVLSGFMGLFLFSSCQGCSGDTPAQSDEEPEKEAVAVNEINELPRFEVNDTVNVGGRTFHYTLVREPSADLPVVYNEMSGNTRDNVIELTVSCRGEQVFRHKFTKESFKEQTPEDTYPVALLQEAGVEDRQPGGLPRFWFSLGELNCDLVTFAVTLSPDGTFTYEPVVFDFMSEEWE